MPPVCWTVRPSASQRTIALDGKVLRRSFDNFTDRKAAQLLHAFDTEAGLVLAHIDIDEKSNEIPAAQQLLGELQVAHSIITLDALHCQKKPSRPPRRPQAQAIIQLKDNQPTLLQNAETACASLQSHQPATPRSPPRAIGMKPGPPTCSAPPARWLNTEWKPLIKDIVRVTRDVLHRSAKTGLWSSTSEVAYYLAISAVSASHSAAAIRSHWHVENKLHYTRDVTFQEDQLAHPSQPRDLRPAAQLRIQHTAPQSNQYLQSGQIRRRSRRTRCPDQVVLQLRALNSPGCSPYNRAKSIYPRSMT